MHTNISGEIREKLGVRSNRGKNELQLENTKCIDNKVCGMECSCDHKSWFFINEIHVSKFPAVEIVFLCVRKHPKWIIHEFEPLGKSDRHKILTEHWTLVVTQHVDKITQKIEEEGGREIHGRDTTSNWFHWVEADCLLVYFFIFFNSKCLILNRCFHLLIYYNAYSKWHS